MKEKFADKKNLFLIVIVVILLLIFLIFKIFFNQSSKKSDIIIVNSSSKFYTVSGCVSRYLNYLYTEDVDNLLILLDNQYKKNNKLNRDNIFNKIEKLDGIYSFEAHLMYQESLKSKMTKYYVKGVLVPEEMDSFDSDANKVFYVIVTLDEKNSTYSITPYDGELFLNGGI